MKVKVWVFATALLTWDRLKSKPAALYNLGSGSRLTWVNDTVAHYVAIHCPRWLTTGPAEQHTDIPPPRSVHYRPSSRSSWATTHLRPAEGRRLSWLEEAELLLSKKQELASHGTSYPCSYTTVHLLVGHNVGLKLLCLYADLNKSAIRHFLVTCLHPIATSLPGQRFSSDDEPNFCRG